MRNKKFYRRLIVVLSVVIPVLVAALFRIRIEGVDLSFLPPIYAFINGTTAVILLVALWAIKNKRIKTHKVLMYVCMWLSASFLVMYVLYHMTSDPTVFGGDSVLRYIYLFVLVTHIMLSILVVPLVLFTFYAAFFGDFNQHKRLAKLTFPVWFYVASTGVVVYIMISPYY